MPQKTLIPTTIELKREGWKRDYFRWQRYFIGEKLTAKTPKFHEELIALFDSQANKYIAAAAPRGHAKTTLISRGFSAWKLLHGEPFVVLVGESYTMACNNLAAIRFELKNNQKIVDEYAPKFERDREDDLIFSTAYGRVRVVAVGCGQGLRGHLENYRRPTLIIVDDLEEDKRVKNADLRNEDMDWLMSVLVPALDPNVGRLVVIGTILHVDSVLARIVGLEKKNEQDEQQPMQGWTTARYKAIQNDGTALWEEYLGIEKLLALKTQFERAGRLHKFYQEYQNDPRQAEDAEFSENWIQWVNLSDPAKAEWWAKKKARLNVYFSMDTAWSKATQADRTAMACCGWDEFFNCFIFPPKAGRWGIAEAWDEIVKFKELYHPRRYGIEQGATKAALDEVLERENRLRGWQIRFDGLPAKGNEVLIRAFFMLMGRGEVYLVGKPEEFKELLEEWRSFPNGVHDDLAVAVAHQVQMAQPSASEKRKAPEPGTGGAVLDALMKKAFNG